MTKLSHTGAGVESMPSGDAGVEMVLFQQAGRAIYLDREWLATLTMVGGASSVFQVWGRRDDVWGVIGFLYDGVTLPTDTTFYTTIDDLRFYDRICARCTSGGPTSYTFALEEARADG